MSIANHAPDKPAHSRRHGLKARIEWEKAALGMLMLDDDAVHVYRLESMTWWALERHSLIYMAIMDLLRAKMPVDEITVAHTLKEAGVLSYSGGTAYLAELTELHCEPVHSEHAQASHGDSHPTADQSGA